MNIPPYWVSGNCEVAGMRFRLHGSSAQSMDEARARMAARERLVRAFHETHTLPLADFRRELTCLLQQEKGHAYEVEMFEPTLERLTEHSLITRNRYGVEVLNTTELCLVDVDDFPASAWERLKHLFGAPARSDEQRLLAEMELLHREQPDLSMRLYRTAAGWRVILQAEGLSLKSPRLAKLEQRLKADPLYVSLCHRQQSWRARLTPKPGRLASGLGRFPRRTASDTAAQGEEEWIARYTAACVGKATCRLVERFGADIHHPLVALHDERTAALQCGLPLA